MASMSEHVSPTIAAPPDRRVVHEPRTQPAAAQHSATPQSWHDVHLPHLRMQQLGLWLFFFSETFLFSALLASRFYLSGVERPEHLNQILGLGITSILLLSSVTAYQSEVAIKQNRVGACLAYLTLTILMGIVFAGGVAYEWATAEFFAGEPYGSSFFAMTGLHATHVISGVGLLMLVYRLARRGRFSSENYWGVEAAVKYWHFVDLVWVFFYPALYLVNW